MENTAQLLKAIADETRLELVNLLLHRNYCVGVLARRLELSEAAVSQHLKILREAGFLTGEKHGYFMHYHVNKDALLALAAVFEDMAEIKREPCDPENEGCLEKRQGMCHAHRCAEECESHLGHTCRKKIENETSEGELENE